MDKDVVIALIAVIPSFLGGLFLLINTKLSKRMDKLLTQTQENDIMSVENTLLEKLLPVFEAKDAALDRIADILAEEQRLQELTNHSIQTRLDTMQKLIEAKCQAPVLLQEMQHLTRRLDEEEVNRAILKSLLEDENTVEHS